MKLFETNYDKNIIKNWIIQKSQDILNNLSGNLSASNTLFFCHCLAFDFAIYDEHGNSDGVIIEIDDEGASFIIDAPYITVPSKECASCIAEYFTRTFNISTTYLTNKVEMKICDIMGYAKHYEKTIEKDVKVWLTNQINNISENLSRKIDATVSLLDLETHFAYCFDMEDEHGKLYSITFIISYNDINFYFDNPTVPSQECATCITKFIAKYFSININYP